MIDNKFGEMMMNTSMVNVIQPDGEAILVAIPWGGRYRIAAEADGVRWLTVRTWWGRVVRHLPVATEAPRDGRNKTPF